MPTINQLVRKKRQDQTRKSKAPALQVTKNSIKGKTTQLSKGSPQKR